MFSWQTIIQTFNLKVYILQEENYIFSRSKNKPKFFNFEIHIVSVMQQQQFFVQKQKMNFFNQQKYPFVMIHHFHEFRFTIGRFASLFVDNSESKNTRNYFVVV